MQQTLRHAGRVLFCLVFALAFHFPFLAPAYALEYTYEVRGPLPIPPAERNLVTEKGKPYFEVSTDNRILEAAVFDRDGSLLFCDVTGKRIMRLTEDKKLSEVYAMQDGYAPSGLAFHRDGRLFVVANKSGKDEGGIFALDLASGKLETILSPTLGYRPNDLCFDKNGGFYFTDFRGSATEPLGGAFYASPDYKTITPVIPHLAKANGVALSPDGKVLYVTEFARNVLHLVMLASPTRALPTGSFVAYYFTGPGPDSMRVDSDGNLYIGIVRQGRVLCLNKYGIPIGQVLLPGREKERHIRTTCMAIKPGSRKMLILTGSDRANHVDGSHIFEATAFAPGLSHPVNSK